MTPDRWIVLIGGLLLVAFIVRFFWLKSAKCVRLKFRRDFSWTGVVYDETLRRVMVVPQRIAEEEV